MKCATGKRIGKLQRDTKNIVVRTKVLNDGRKVRDGMGLK
jgi:hypothetical protein